MSMKKFNRDEKRHIENTFTSFLQRMHWLIEPPKILEAIEDPAEMYYALMPADVQPVMKSLAELHRRYDKFLRETWYLAPKIRVELDETMTRVAGTFDVKLEIRGDGKYIPVFEPHKFPVMDSEHPMYKEVAEWVKNSLRMKFAVDKAVKFLDDLNDATNTPGQWARAFPEIQMALTGEMQRAIANAKRNSPMPRHIDREKLAVMRPPIVHMLTKCAMLPEYKSNQRLITVTDNWSRI